MWGSPGTLLAALFLFERTGSRAGPICFAPRAAAPFRARVVGGAPLRLWTQHLYGRESSYLDAVHGFVATALPLIRGRHLLDAAEWEAWQARSSKRSRAPPTGRAQANWRAQLNASPAPSRRLVQFCHGAPGFVVCLAGLPSTELDALLLAAGETTWAAGPLDQGLQPVPWHRRQRLRFPQAASAQRRSALARAGARLRHARHRQTERDAERYGQGRYSLWTGDLGFAIYLWDCLRAEAQFPTLDVFFAGDPPAG